MYSSRLRQVQVVMHWALGKPGAECSALLIATALSGVRLLIKVNGRLACSMKACKHGRQRQAGNANMILVIASDAWSALFHNMQMGYRACGMQAARQVALYKQLHPA